MNNNSFISDSVLKKIGFKHYGKKVLISKKASFYDAGSISIGDNVRIDDFCILSGNIIIGNNVHIAAGTYIFGGDIGVEIGDCCGISSRCGIYAISDDFSGQAFVGPMFPDYLRNVIRKKVILEKHVVIGTSVTVLPGAYIEEGSVVGALSLVKSRLESWGIYFGIPCARKKERKKTFLDLREGLNK